MNIDLAAIPQMELTRRYREARRVWATGPFARTASWPLHLTEREYCDRAIVLWFPEAIIWASSSTEPVALDYDRAFREAGQ